MGSKQSNNLGIWIYPRVSDVTLQALDRLRASDCDKEWDLESNLTRLFEFYQYAKSKTVNFIVLVHGRVAKIGKVRDSNLTSSFFPTGHFVCRDSPISSPAKMPCMTLRILINTTCCRLANLSTDFRSSQLSESAPLLPRSALLVLGLQRSIIYTQQASCSGPEYGASSENDEIFCEGRFYVQDNASQLSARLPSKANWRCRVVNLHLLHR